MTPARESLVTAPLGSVPWLQAHMVAMVCALQNGQVEDADALMARLFEIEVTVENAYLFATTLSGAAHMLDLMGRIQDGNRLTKRAFPALAPFATRVPSVDLIVRIVTSMREQLGNENPAWGLSAVEPAPALAETLGLRRFVTMAVIVRELHAFLLGDANIERLMAWVGVPDEELGLATPLRPFIFAWRLAETGNFDDARLWANRLIALGQSRGVPSDEGRGRWLLAEVSRRAGDLDVAERQIVSALALLRLACPLEVPGALATLAALRLDQGKPDEALATAEEALSLYESMGACSFFMRGAFLRLVHVECLEAAGRHEDACKALAEAKRRLLRNADKIEDPAYRKSFLENVPENRKTLELARQWLGEDA